jgi:hypothetical protein
MVIPVWTPRWVEKNPRCKKSLQRSGSLWKMKALDISLTAPARLKPQSLGHAAVALKPSRASGFSGRPRSWRPLPQAQAPDRCPFQMPPPDKPPRLARVPDFRCVFGDAKHHKSLAYSAHKAARAAQPIPSAILDRLWVHALTATELVPPPVQAKMWRRHETLCMLLLDMHRWPRA